MSRRTLPMPTRLASAVLLLMVGSLGWPAPTHGQEAGTAGPVSPDSADAMRRSLERPPAEHPVDLGDVVSVPFELAALPLRLTFDGLAEVVGYVAVPERYRAIRNFYRDVRATGLRPGLTTDLGPQSGLGVSMGYVGLRPLNLEVAGSLNGSQRYRAHVELGEDPWRGRLHVDFSRHSQESFWGVGIDAPPGLRSDVLHDRWSAGASTAIRWGWGLELRGGLGFEEHDVGRGWDDGRPDLQDVFDPDTLFGATRPTRFLRGDLEATVDGTRWRDLQIQGLRGGVAVRRWRGVEGTPANITATEGWLHGFLPVTARHLLALRIRARTTRGGDRGIPFTHLPSLGGDILRSYDTGRFRDADLLAGSVEWRYEVWRDLRERGRVEGFVFWDEGSVAPRLDRLSDSVSSWGGGLALAWNQRMTARGWIAHGREGTRLSGSVSQVF